MAEKFAGLETVHEDFGEREVRAVILYASASKLYVDAEHTTEVAYAVAVDLCVKGYLRVVDTDVHYAVTSFSDSAGTLTVNYGEAQTATVTAPVK